MYEPSKIAENIKKTAKEHGFQLKDMLIELDLNKNTLSNMYNGSMLKADSLARIYFTCSACTQNKLMVRKVAHKHNL